MKKSFILLLMMTILFSDVSDFHVQIKIISFLFNTNATFPFCRFVTVITSHRKGKINAPFFVRLMEIKMTFRNFGGTQILR